MAPQVENGYVRIANELADELCKIHLSGNEWKVIFAVLRKTWGWNKKKDMISLTQFQKMTNLHRFRVNEAIKELVTKNVLVVDKDGSTNVYCFNKDYSQWTSHENRTSHGLGSNSHSTVTTLVTKTVPKLVTKTVHTKDNKDNITKDTIQKTEYTSLEKLSDEVFAEIATKYRVPVPFVLSKYDDLVNYCGSKGKRYKDYRLALMNWVKSDAIKISQQAIKNSKYAVTEV